MKSEDNVIRLPSSHRFYFTSFDTKTDTGTICCVSEKEGTIMEHKMNGREWRELCSHMTLMLEAID